MRHKALAVIVAAVTLLTLSAGPANAVTNGEPDGEGHPYVGIMVAHDEEGNPLWRCTGTLISPTVFLTAGHCTEAPAYSAEVWFASDLEPNPALLGYPSDGEVSGKTHVYPGYDPDAFYLHDLGLVELDDAVEMDTYGVLPAVNAIDAYAKNKKKELTFDSVGYGLQKAFPDASSWKDVALRTRMIAHPKLIQANTGYTGTGSLILSNNAKTGGTCFGDSGGPNFLAGTNIVLGVTSFGKNPTCAGQGGIYRVDRADDQAWINDFING